jgi:EAL domain-containing protein (putative c-di-GMP-specific phosphodiesterase class I)/CheY-like chemotaxis protein
MRILIFDDDPAVGRLVARIATMSGMDAAAVTTADQFALCFKIDPPEIVMLDLQLGDTDGVSQLRRLAEWEFKGSLLLMSGFDARVLSTACVLAEHLGLNIEGALEKPLRLAELEQKLAGFQPRTQPLSAERLLAAIADDELFLEFQPIVTRHPPGLKKLEALVRWQHPGAGRIAPGDFLPMAEEQPEAINALTEWVLGAAMEAYKTLAEVGIKVPFAVNISALNLCDMTFPDRLERRMREAGMSASQMCLEITETAAFKEPHATMDILSRLRLKGVQLSIDDFGIGYSSLKILRQMPFTEIKIDRSFIKDMTTSRDSRAIAESIVHLAATMEMDCVAEGIETEETAELLESLGACFLQGYFIARPMRVEAVPGWLDLWTRREQLSRNPEWQENLSDVMQIPFPAGSLKLPGGDSAAPRLALPSASTG